MCGDLTVSLPLSVGALPHKVSSGGGILGFGARLSRVPLVRWSFRRCRAGLKAQCIQVTSAGCGSHNR